MKVGDLVESNSKFYKNYEDLYPGTPHYRHYGIIFKVYKNTKRTVSFYPEEDIMIDVYLSNGKINTFNRKNVKKHGLRLVSES